MMNTDFLKDERIIIEISNERAYAQKGIEYKGDFRIELESKLGNDWLTTIREYYEMYFYEFMNKYWNAKTRMLEI